MIDLLKVFKDCPEYTIMKIRGTFPEFEVGQDIDIVCGDLDGTYMYLVKMFLDNEVFRIGHRSKTHVHFDIVDAEGGIVLRFDLYSEFISPKLTKDILDHKMEVKCGDDIIWIAGYHEDILIKSWEYHTNGKQKYRDYAKFKDGLDAYKDR